MYHAPSKRRQLIQRIVVYSLMSIAVVALVIVLVFVMLGYQLDQANGKIEQGGLVQFDSLPNGADITIDGANFGTQTASKTTMTSGQHFITMEKSGYKTWQKSIDVVPGSVLWLTYARLIPKDLPPTNVATYPSLSSTASSPDDKWMAAVEDAVTPTIRLADLSQSPIKFSELALPGGSYTHPSDGKTQSFSLVTWDPGSRYLLVKHTYDDAKMEWLVVDTQDVSQTKNVTALLDIDASSIVFSGNNSSILYAQIGTDVRKIDLDAATLSRPLVSNVAEFSLFNNTSIAYTTLLDPVTKMRTVGYYQDGAAQAYPIRSYNDDGQAPLHIAIGTYFGQTYVAINYGDTLTVLDGNLPQGSASPPLSHVSSATLPGGAQYLTIMNDGRFVVAQNGSIYQVYDIELKKTTTTTLKGTSPVTKQLSWLDNYMVWSDRDSMVRLYEFDGANQNDIMPVTPGFSVTLSPDSKYIYGMIKSNDGQFHLERVQLILP
jgi:hypothetical protein